MGKFVTSILKKKRSNRKGGSYKSGTIYVPTRDNKWTHRLGNQCDMEYEWKFCGGEYPRIRVPSLKRSKKCWRNFYSLFPFIYEEAKRSGRWVFKGLKLKPL